MEPIGRQLDAARRGESEALSILYRQFLPGVFGYIATRVPDRATTEDLTSEVFLKMVEGIAAQTTAITMKSSNENGNNGSGNNGGHGNSNNNGKPDKTPTSHH